jgi:hypothetical protein
MTKVNINGVSRDMTAEEQAAYDAQQKAYVDGSEARKLEEIKKVRLEKLQATDWMSNSDVTMPDYIKTWRQSLRDIPTNHTNESAYNLLLARDSDGELTHSIWTQPTE